MKDFRGREIQVGDLIVHASRYSSSMWLCEADVLEVHDKYIIVNKRRTNYRNEPVQTRDSKLVRSEYIAVLDR